MDEWKGRALFGYVHQPVMLSVIMKYHYPILVSLLFLRYPYYILKSFMQNTSSQLFNHLNRKVWSRLSATFQKFVLAFSSQARTVNLCPAPTKHHHLCIAFMNSIYIY